MKGNINNGYFPFAKVPVVLVWIKLCEIILR